MTIADKTFTDPFDFIPEAASGQALGDATHLWDVYGGQATFGNNGGIIASVVVNVDEVWTDLAGTFYALVFRARANPGAGFASSFIGVSGQASLQANQVQAAGSFTGVQAVAVGEAGVTGTINIARAVQAAVDVEDTTCTTARTIDVVLPEVDTGALTTGYGIHIQQPAIGAGAITTQYGIRIESITTAGTNWAIYTNTGDIRFGGNVGIAMNPTANGLLCLGTPTENLEFIDAGSAGATEQDWIEVECNGVQGYVHVFAAK